MKSALRLADSLEHMQQAAAEAIGFVGGMDKTAFVGDRLTQQAVLFNLVVLGETAGNVLTSHAGFTEQHADIPWRSIGATHDRIAHGYFDINLDVVWDTVQTALPQLVSLLPAVMEAARRDATRDDPPPATAAS